MREKQGTDFFDRKTNVRKQNDFCATTTTKINQIFSLFNIFVFIMIRQKKQGTGWVIESREPKGQFEQYLKGSYRTMKSLTDLD